MEGSPTGVIAIVSHEMAATSTGGRSVMENKGASAIASLEDVNLLLNIAAHSINIKELSIEEPGGKCYLRPTLHIFLSAPFGRGKSRLL